MDERVLVADTSGDHTAPAEVVARGEQVRVKHFTSRLYRPDGLDFHVAPGEVLVVTGPTGCGKSSLALTLNGLIPQHVEADLEGTVAVLGADVRSTRITDLARDVGMVFQDPDTQIVTTRVLDEVCFGLENLLVPAEQVEGDAMAALADVGLDDLADERPSRLSGGQRQRLALACAIAMRPRLLVLDEPTSHVDPRGAVEFLELLPRLRDDGMTVVIVDHDLDRVLGYADRLLVLDRAGRVLADGDPTAVTATHWAAMAAAGVRLPVAFRVRQALVAAGASGLDTTVTPSAVRRSLADADTAACPAPAIADPVPSRSGEVLLHAEHLQVRRGRRIVVPDLSLTIHRGGFTAILGTNGAGKTTAGLALAGLIRSRGVLRVDGTDPRKLSMRELSDRVGYVFQNPEHQFVTNTAADEIAHGMRRRGLPEHEVSTQVDTLLDRLELGDVREQHPFRLSGGQKRRLSVATVLATRPDLLILDEPSYGLDEGATESLMDLLSGLVADGATIVTIVHDLGLAATHADRILVLQAGGIAADGPPGAVLTDDALLQRCGLAPLPVRECLRDLAARDPRFVGVWRIDQLRGTGR